MIGKDKAYALAERALWLIEEYVTIAAQPRSYGTDMKFHRLDIHLIHSIGTTPGINVTELAEKHGITKSAVSQAVKNLEHRKLIERFQSADNRKTVRFRLLERGTIAFEAHNRFHRESETPYLRRLADLSPAEARGAEKLLEILEDRAEYQLQTMRRSMDTKK